MKKQGLGTWDWKLGKQHQTLIPKCHSPILGLDPGLTATGYGLLAPKKIGYGVIKSNPSQPLGERIRFVINRLDQILKKVNPKVCAIETIFFKPVGARSIILMAHLRGALFYILTRHSIPVVEITPAQVKLSVTGNGRASKKQIQYMIKALLKIKDKIPEDAADALAVAYSLASRNRLIQKLPKR